MTKTAWRELKSAEETAQRLEAEGYQVEYEVSVSDGEKQNHFDLVARRNGDVVAFEFVPLRNFDKFAPQISALRQLATQNGYTDFRVVVVPDTKTTQLSITGLESDILVVAQDRWNRVADKEEWETFSPQRVTSVTLFNIENTEGEEGARVTGQCVVEFVSNVYIEEVRDCLMSFDLRLDGHWKVIMDDERNHASIILDFGD